MNIDFNILWLEDNDEWYSAEKEDIEEYILGFCFTPKIIRLKSIPNDELEAAIKNKRFDLIFADLNLDKSDKGNIAIQYLRDKNILADALFYSTDGIEQIKSVMKNEVLEGVYLSLRDEILFPKKAKELIDKIIKRSEDILNVRGLVMDNVSEFDEKLKDVIKKFMSISGDGIRSFLDKYAYDKVIEQISDKIKYVEDNSEGFILNILSDSYILDSYKLSMIVNKIFKKYYPEYSDMRNFHDSYWKDILKERNQLAHAKKEPEADGVFYFIDKTGNRTDYNSAKCREIRAKINKYDRLLNEVIDYVK